MSGKKLFISHSSKDEKLVEAFVELIERGVGVHPTEIFCSSLQGQGVEPGVEFKTSIRNRLGNAECVIALISLNFYSSAFCMCELGGVWMLANKLIPIIIPPIGFDDLRAVLEGIQVLKIDNGSHLDQLKDEIGKLPGIEPIPTPRWNERRERFLKALPEILQNLPNDSPVPRESHQKILSELERFKAESLKAKEKIEESDKLIRELRKLKDASSVAGVLKKHSKELKDFPEFEELISNARIALSSLSLVTRETLYYRARGEDYYPENPDDWREAKQAIEYGQIVLNSEENGVVPYTRHPKVKNAINTLDEIGRWLASAPVEFSEWYERKFDGEEANIELRLFWERHFS